MTDRIEVTYRVESTADAIEARAAGLAVEQSVEMPVAAIDDAFVLAETVGRVLAITEICPGCFDVRIGLASATTGGRAGQLLNMLFGNSSIQRDVTLIDADLPPAPTFGGPNLGLEGLRALVGGQAQAGKQGRALTCSALKPQGLSAPALAELAARLTAGGIDFIKDDHGLADQSYSPFATRVPAIAGAVATAGGKTRYLPSLCGSLDDIRAQVALAKSVGLVGALIAPMIVGVETFLAVRRENPDFAFMTHPAYAGAAKVAPAFLLGKLFRLLGSDATVFPNYGGRFGYTPAECRTLAANCLAANGLKPAVPVPAGGMTLERVPEILDFYGNDVMLLIGGNLLAARERIPAETAKIVAAVRSRGIS